MKYQEITSENEYRLVLERIEEIFDSEPETPEGAELEILSKRISDYEKEHFPFD